MAESNALIEKREHFHAKQAELKEVFDLARDGAVYDFSRKTVLDKLGAADSADALYKVKARNVELDNLSDEVQHLQKKSIESEIAERDALINQPANGGASHPVGSVESKSWGQLFVESKAYREGYRKEQRRGLPVEIDVSLKALFETTAGFAPESIRSGRVVPAVAPALRLIDLIPIVPINQSVEKYMEQTTSTSGALEKAEGVAFGESTIVYTERTSDVRKITDSLPVTDEQLEDELQVRSLIEQQLRYNLMRRLDSEVVAGDGVAPNLRGVLDAGFGIQTQAKGADPTFDAILRAITKVRVGGGANPNAVVMHPNDWVDVRLTRTADGLYIMGPPSEPGATTFFGLPVVQSEHCTENTALVGDWANFTRISERRGVTLQIGYSGTQFAEGKSLLRADVRVAFTVYRPYAICSVTGI